MSEIPTVNDILDDIYDDILDGNIAGVKTNVQAALDAGLVPGTILNEGMIAAMSEVGQRYECGDIYVAEMLISARSLQAGLAILKPHLRETNVKATGKVVIGTVRGDLHDIGKNLVAMMLEGAGFEIEDLGTDVSPQRFVAAVQASHPDVVALSVLLTTTMPSMLTTIQALQAAGLRDQVKVIVGGAPVNEEYPLEVGADGYAADASQAVTLTKVLLGL